MTVLKKIILVLLLIMSTSCHFQMGQPGPSENELRGPQIFTGELNISINNGMFTAYYEDYIFYYDSVESGVKVLNTATNEAKLIYQIDAISAITANSEFVFFIAKDRIYQIDYDGKPIGIVDGFDTIKALAVHADTLYVYGQWSNEYYDLYSLPVSNISSKPVYLKGTFDYNSVGFTKIYGITYGSSLFYVTRIDEKNSLIIGASKENDRFHNVRYSLVQDDFVAYGDYLMIDKNDNVYSCYSTWASSETGKLVCSDDMKIELPNKYEYLSMYKSSTPGYFLLLGKNFGSLVRNGSSQLISYHESDILLEIDIENETSETLIATQKGERIVGYWNGKVLLLNDQKISVFDPTTGEKEGLFEFKKVSSGSDLRAQILNGYLFIYETDELRLCEELTW